jgi:hypothetical protein
MESKKVISLEVKGLAESIKSFDTLNKNVKETNKVVPGSVAELQKIRKELKNVEIGSEAFTKLQAEAFKLQEDLKGAKEAANLLSAELGAFDTGSINDLNAQLKFLQGELDGAKVGTEKYIEANKKIEQVKIQIEAASLSLKEQKTKLVEVGVGIASTFGQGLALVQSFAGENKNAQEAILRLQQVTVAVGAVTQAVEIAKQIAVAKTIAARFAETAATNGATLATKLLGIAVKAALGPVGLLIAAVGAIAGAVAIFTDKTEDNEEALKKNKEARAELQKKNLEWLKAEKELNIVLSTTNKQLREIKLKQSEVSDEKQKNEEITKKLVETENALAKARTDNRTSMAELIILEDTIKNLRAEQVQSTLSLTKSEEDLGDKLKELAKKQIDIQTEVTKNKIESDKLKIDSTNELNSVILFDLQTQKERIELLAEAQKAAIDSEFFDKQRIVNFEKEKSIEREKIQKELLTKLTTIQKEYNEDAVKFTVDKISKEIEEENRKKEQIVRIQQELLVAEENAKQQTINNLREKSRNEKLSADERIAIIKRLYEVQQFLTDEDVEAFEKAQQQKIDIAIAKTKQYAEISKNITGEINNLLNQISENRIATIDKEIEVVDERISFLDEQLKTQAEKIAEAEEAFRNSNATNTAEALANLETQRAIERKLENERKNAEQEKLNLEKKKKEEQIKAAKREKAINIASIIQATSLAIITALAQVPKADIGISAGILAASYGVVGAAQLATALATPLPQFAEGGYTKKGGKYEPAGIVHAGEYVVPATILQNPIGNMFVSQLENMRLKGYSDGGLVGGTTNNITNITNQQAQIPEIVVSVESIDRVKDSVLRAQSRATL